MGKLEKAVRIKNRRINLQKFILGALCALGGLSVAVIAPNMIKILAKIQPNFIKNRIKS